MPTDCFKLVCRYSACSAARKQTCVSLNIKKSLFSLMNMTLKRLLYYPMHKHDFPLFLYACEFCNRELKNKLFRISVTYCRCEWIFVFFVLFNSSFFFPRLCFYLSEFLLIFILLKLRVFWNVFNISTISDNVMPLIMNVGFPF